MKNPHPAPSPLIKFCGLTTPDALRKADALQVDWVGLVFYPPSPRALDLPRASALLAHYRPSARVVALVVDADDTLLESVVTIVRPDLLQCHGQETPQRLHALKARYGLPLVRALSIRSPDDLSRSEEYAASADWLLLDAPPPAGSTLPGGNAHAFDWSWLEGWKAPLPWLLAGGLTADTVAGAIRRCQPDGVDVSSGIEREKGVKDLTLMEKFVASVRGHATDRSSA
jgi:phosphoribosylanthranilate isomerase